MGRFSKLLDSIIGSISPIQAVKRAHARAILKRLNGSYDASKNSEVMRSMQASGLSANADLVGNIDVLRRRSRQADRNYPQARAAIETRLGIVVSTGIDLEPNTGNKEQDKKLREAWRVWCDEADAAGRLHFKELQRQAFRCMDLNGSSLWQLVTLNEPDRLIPTALHAIEADQLSPEPVGTIAVGNRFANGVEFNEFGREEWFHIIDHPGDEGPLSLKKEGRGRRIPAKDIIHMYEARRPGQNIGEPSLVPCLKRFVQEEELVAAELESAKVASAFAVAITTAEQIGGSLDLDEEAGEDNTDEAGNEITSLTSGAIAKLAPGEQVTTIANNRPSQQIDPFRKMLRGDSAASLGIGRVDLDKDYSEANYSSMRADMLDKKRALTPVQNWFGRQAVSDVYKRIFAELAAAANIDLAPANSMERKRQMRHKIVPDGFAYVDPEKDIKASILAITHGLSNYQTELGQRGEDYREIHDQLEKELDSSFIQKLVNWFMTKTKSDSNKSNNKKDDSREISLKDNKHAA